MSKNQENAEQQTHPLFTQRWSPRAFDANKKVSSEDLNSCLEAARWAPSCFGAEPWRFIVCHKESDEESWQNLLSCLAPKNQEWAKFAPVLLMVCTQKQFEHNGSDNAWAEYDTGAASVSFCLQAAALGLVTHQMGGFDAGMVTEKFSIPQGVKAMAAMTLGYQGESSQLDEAFQAMEDAPRKSIVDIMKFNVA